MEYNTQREQLKISDYGRHVAKMVDYCKTISDRDERTAERACLEYAKALESALRATLGEDGRLDLLLLVAAEAPVARISGYTRYQILIKLLRTKRLKDALETVSVFHDAHRDACAEVQLEINPQEMF